MKKFNQKCQYGCYQIGFASFIVFEGPYFVTQYNKLGTSPGGKATPTF